ncbi:MAG TPA: hypothetical protein VK774_03340 [Solirubrobacteraceae bacterium]|nr:hypothetical protein [Solirubrobacteraceae bacterium]
MAVVIAMLIVAASAAAASAPLPKPGSKWSTSLKGQKYESGSIAFSVVKQGKRVLAKGTATLHTACFPVEQGQTLKVGPTHTFSFSGQFDGQAFVAKKGSSEALLHWEIRGSLKAKKLVVAYAEETEGPPRISCGFNETAIGKLKQKG